MNMMKRISAFLLALIWALALTACGAPGAGAPSPTPDAVPSAAATAEPSAPSETGPAETEEPSSPEETTPSETQSLAATEKPSVPEETTPEETEEPSAPEETTPAVSEAGRYDSKEDVALYLHLYGHLPDNYVTKQKAEALGWTGGSVERYAGEGAAIGGSRFGNYEGLLPEAKGRTYTECDIGTVGSSSRGAKRLVFSNDGLIYYTEDHYESFELLYGEP